MGVCDHFDHQALSAVEDPFALIREMVDTCPVGRSQEHGGFWVLNRHADVTAAARNAAMFSSQANGVGIPHHGFPMVLPPIETDPPLHTQFRVPLLEAFSPRACEEWRALSAEVVNDLVDAFIEKGECDLAEQLTIQLPSIVATAFLGLPAEDGDKLHAWAARLTRAGDVDAIAEVLEYFGELYDSLKEQAEAGQTGDTIPWLVFNLEIDGGPIPEDQFLLGMSMIFSAGLDTTANAGAHMLLLLARHPEIRADIAAHLDEVESAVEELLRFTAPLPLLGRTAMAETEVGGETIHEGERVALHWMAANRDPDEFPDPDEFQRLREPNRHLSFGGGPHRCLGANLARVELQELIRIVLTRMPEYDIAFDEIEHYPAVVRGVSKLPATFAPGTRVGG